MICGHIHAPATLPNYVHMHLMNRALRRQAAILETWYVYFYATVGLLLPSHDTLAVWATQSPFLEQSLAQSAKRCCLQEHLNNSVFCSRMFLLCTPLQYDHTPYLISLLTHGTPFPTVAQYVTTSTKMD